MKTPLPISDKELISLSKASWLAGTPSPHLIEWLIMVKNVIIKKGQLSLITKTYDDIELDFQLYQCLYHNDQKILMGYKRKA